jgi:hypothetical protein
MIIVAPLHQPGVAGAPQAPVDNSNMQCADWRELDMGSGGVQVCE